ncbi:unnamed protein product [Arctia plantaginis]|uniref:Major facilitator superfamily (MFS) profile domain-containing protein n=1 Tax=Arctia plantaginis TaxID=874455 RepID=A0A8S1AJQ8_ARCPL|nr:unnamed protein product [Arctia plantaginis]
MSRNPENPETPHESEKASQPKPSGNEESTQPQSPVKTSPLGDYSLEELEEGLSIIGLGRYNLKYAMFIALLLVSSMIEVVGNSVVLPAAQCDLGISDGMQGIIAAIPFIGIVLTAYFHGYLIDTRGRKKMAVMTSLAAGCTGFLTAFMPNLALFAFFKFITALWIAVPSTLPYTFIAEIIPKEHRVVLLTVVNALQLMGSAIDPLIAWIIIPMDFQINFGLYMFRPWRLLIIIYAMFFILTAYLLASGPESPKFLLSRGKPEEALKVLRTMYAHNHNKAPEDFPIKSLHAPPLTEPVNMVECLKRQTTPLLEEQYLKYILLNGFLLFGVFVILNGVYVWILEALNRVLSYDDNDQTACQIIMESVENDDQDNTCDDMIDTTSIMMNSIAQVVCAIIGIGISFTIKCIGKSYVLFYCFFIIGTCCLIVNFISDSTLFLILTSLFPLITLAIGPINLYCMEIYPVHMRGMAVLLCMMLGRMGSIIGSTMTGIMINRACHAMFYLCAILLYVCASLSLFLPGAQMMQNIKNLSKRQ